MEISFDSNTERLEQDYQMSCIQLNMVDIVTTYLGVPKMRRQDELKAEHKAPITGDCYLPGNLSDSTDCKILLDTGA